MNYLGPLLQLAKMTEKSPSEVYDRIVQEYKKREVSELTSTQLFNALNDDKEIVAAVGRSSNTLAAFLSSKLADKFRFNADQTKVTCLSAERDLTGGRSWSKAAVVEGPSVKPGNLITTLVPSSSSGVEAYDPTTNAAVGGSTTATYRPGSSSGTRGTPKFEEYVLKEDSELRFEVSRGEVIAELTEGLAEIFGTELILNRRYVFPAGSRVGIYTWQGCRIELVGEPEGAYKTSNTPMVIYLNTHAALEMMRQHAAKTGTRGPRLMVAGPTDVGKSTVCRILLNYAARLSRHPIFVDLDLGQSSIAIPGTIGAVYVERPADPVEGFCKDTPLVFHFGHTTPAANMTLYSTLVSRLASVVFSKCARLAAANVGGVIINTCGWVKGQGYTALTDAAEAFEVDVVVVLDHERLYNELQKDLPGFVKVVHLPKSGGVEERNRKQRAQLRCERVREYFYGTKKRPLYPHSFDVTFDEVGVYKIGAPQLPDSCLPMGTSIEDDAPIRLVKLNPTDRSIELKNRVLSVSLSEQADESVVTTNVAGFVVCTDVDYEKKRMTLLSPQPYPLARNVLLLGSLLTYVPPDGGSAQLYSTIIALEDGFVMARVVFLGNELLDLGQAARESFIADLDLLKRAPTNQRESLHVEALLHFSNGDWNAASDCWEMILSFSPLDIVALKFHYVTQIYMGCQRALTEHTGQLLTVYKERLPHMYGFVLGMFAFGLEEQGLYDRARREAGIALTLHGGDAWAVHAMVHTYEMEGRATEGDIFMRGSWGQWRNCELAGHLSWHWALLHIDAARFDDARRLFDDVLAPRLQRSPSMTDVVDSACLLFRLQLETSDPADADRWRLVSAVASGHTAFHQYAFNDAHLVMAYIGAGEMTKAAEFVSSIRRYVSDHSDTFNAQVLRDVGLPVCDAMLLSAKGCSADAADKLLPVMRNIHRMGGSNAARSVFELVFLDICAKSTLNRHTDHATRLIECRLRERCKTEGLYKRMLARLSR